MGWRVELNYRNNYPPQNGINTAISQVPKKLKGHQMRSLILTSTLLITMVGCSAKVTPPAKKSSSAQNANGVRAFEVRMPAEACDSGDSVYSLQNQSVSWVAYKTEELVPVEGIIKAAGWVKGGSESELIFRFSAASLDSEDKLRDDRIKEFILGLGDDDQIEFVLENSEIVQDAMDSATGSEIVELEGTLTMYGQEFSVTVPTILEKSGSKLSMRNGGAVEIDLTETSFMAQKVLELLEIAEVDEMQNTVELEFDFELNEEC